MGFQESVEYLIYRNPIVTGTANTIITIGKAVVPSSMLKPKLEPAGSPAASVTPVLKNVIRPGSPIVQLAGILGASAVALGAYGAHKMYPREGGEEMKRIFETANKYHFIHSLALLGVPLCRWPKLSGFLLVAGMTLFCGTCYYHAFTGNSHLRSLTPWGGSMLICGWLAMAL